MHAGSQPGNTETYVMSGVGSIPNLTIVPPPVGIELMGNEPPPEYVLDQGLSYSAADNYGYLPTGYELSAEWGEHHSIYGLDGQDLHYMGLQAESMPYMYYTPGYGYTQAPLNQYASYVPGALSGLEGTYLGVQPYVNIPSYQPSYQPTTSSPAYFPIIVQPSSDFVPTSSNYPYVLGNGASIATRSATSSAKITPPLGSAGTASSSQLVTSVAAFAMSDASQLSQRNPAAAKPSEGLQINIPASNQSLLQEARMHGIGPLEYQGLSSGPMQSSFQVSHVRTPFAQNHVKIAAQSSGLTEYVPSGIGWSNLEKKSQGNQLKDIPSYMGRHPDALGEQNSGPRKNRPKDQLVSSSVVETAELTQRNTSDAQEGCIVINPDNYNKDDFPVDYPDAKFFVIKSYSEDDVHKSIKYNIWSSTHNGNRRLDSAYADAQRKAIGNSKKCPVFLFFSVNASGQFCGLAEMDGPVDFDKDMNFWQQDKWSGSFHVKWHIIKDVPNANLRHIILENNENKPVTNSRDTQEIPYSAGINMLKIFKSNLLRTSILDDFMFYEERQKKMLEDKFKRHGRIYDDSLYVHAYVSQNTSRSRVETSRVADSQSSDSGQTAHEFGLRPNTVSEHPSKDKEKLQDDTILSPSKIDGKPSGVVIDQSLRTKGKQTNAVVGLSSSADWKLPTTPKDLVPRENILQHGTVVLPSKVELNSKPTASHPPSVEKQSSQDIKQLLKEETGPPNPEEPPKVDGKQIKWRVSRPLSSDGSTNIPNDANGVGKAGFSCSEDQYKNKIHASETSSNKDVKQPELDGKQTKWRISQPPSSDGSTNRLQHVNSVGKASPGDEQFKNKIHASESSSNKDIQSEFEGKQTKWRISRPPSSDGSTTRLKDVNGVSKAGSGEELVKNKIHSSESSSNKDTRSELDGKQSKWRIRSPSSDGSTNRTKGVNGVGQTATTEEQSRHKIDASESSSNKEAQSEDKAGIPSVHPTIGAPRSLGAMEVQVNPIEFVTVGSVQIKVKDLSESNRVSGVGSPPYESKGPKLSKRGTSVDSQE